MHNAQSDNQKNTLYDKITLFFFANQAVLTHRMGFISSSWTSTRSPATIKAQVVLKSLFAPQSATKCQIFNSSSSARERCSCDTSSHRRCIYIHIHLVHRSLFSKIQQSCAAKPVTLATQSASTAPDPFLHFTFECAMKHWSAIEQGHANRLKAFFFSFFFFLFRAVTWLSHIFGAD